MSRIPLRAYNKEIDQLTENGQVPEAIAHCKHILKAFPKHIDTYRLLGQAYLTSQRYSEAADILLRVLSVVPDDFISQIGMSIIREDEGNLDGAIYHMEKAFEVQPSKPAIQDELRRLYGRRDGMEPPKIRLTRGALVRMYMRGELYPQAIAEVRAALSDDPQELDLQVLLARMYYLSGQKVQAAEVCSRLVSKLPYCYEANRILAEVLPGSSRADDARVYQERIQSLDPYMAHLAPGVNESQEVPEAAVQLERLEYSAAAEAAEQPEWTRTVGVAWDQTEQDATPDWMKDEPQQPQAASALPSETTTDMQEEPAAPAETADIPDWMASAGWSSSSGEAVETPAAWQESTDDEDQAAAPADMPDWLKDLAPESSAAVVDSETPADEAWLEGILPASENTQAFAAETEKTVESSALDNISWLEEAETTAAQPSAETLPWLQEEAAQPEPAAQSEPISGIAEPVEAEEDLPDWLKEISAETNLPAEVEAPAEAEISAETELPEWLQEQPAETASAEAQSAEEIPDWLAALQNEPAEETHEPEMGQAEDVTILELPQEEQPRAELETTQPYVDAEAISSPYDGFQPVEILSERQATPDEQVAPMATPGDDIDSALAWLEGLAAKQGADEGTLLTAPETRAEEMPEWLQHTQAETQQAESPTAAVEELDTIEMETPEETEVELIGTVAIFTIPETLNVEETVSSIEQDQPAAQLQEMEAEVQETAPDQPVSEMLVEAGFEPVAEVPVQEQPQVTAPAAENPPALDDIDSALAWLEGLAAKQGADENTLLLSPEDRLETAPEWVASQEVALELPVSQVETSQPENEDLAEETPVAFETSQLEALAQETTSEALSVEQDLVIQQPDQTVEPTQPLAAVTETPVEDLDAGWQIEEEQPTAEEPQAVEILPDWLMHVQADESPATAEELEAVQDDQLPDWLKGIETETEPAASAADVSESTWQPESAAQETVEAEATQPVEVRAEEPQPVVMEEEILTEPIPVGIEPQPAQTVQVSAAASGMLAKAREALSHDRIEQALEHYNQLINQGDNLEETIEDLREATYRHPVNTEVWQTLGDAYRESDRVQDALDAYNKAIELMR